MLLAAYDDAAGVTAAFNLNALEHLNRRLGTDFDPPALSPRGVECGRVADRDASREPARQLVRVGDAFVSFAEGEPLVSEYSHKCTPEMFAAQARAAAGMSSRCGPIRANGSACSCWCPRTRLFWPRFAVRALGIRQSTRSILPDCGDEDPRGFRTSCCTALSSSSAW